MKNEALQDRLSEEILEFIHSRKSLQLASLSKNQEAYASYAPFALGDNCIYVLLSDIAVHAINLKANPKASILIIEDEDSAEQLFARKRVNYSVEAKHIAHESDGWQQGIDTLADRLGPTSRHLSTLSDFKLFSLTVNTGRYVKGFGKAYALKGPELAGSDLNHMRDGHQKREAQASA
ncbi:HugZ family protein [Agaribacterium haliotis]|uniref:HugZ family pyridoxamine 5'-phosphate oxidase n=1 Tax=Agaribacterium haliotis TaxID=2013869 RepID=UPI000BB52DE8|nr:pyridoxamine 5'-phosphate oxidase family protein [Agaribacterium haliotis]